MALPVTISDAEFPIENSYAGPFKVGTAFYIVLKESTGGRPQVYKATDPTSSFSAQDAAGRPAAVPGSMWAVAEGTDIHIATQEDGPTLDGDAHYHRFSTTTDTWSLIDDLIETPVNAPNLRREGVSLALRSDGDIVVLYTGDTDKVMGVTFNRCDYARFEGTSWSVGINVGGQGLEENHVAGVVVRGASDKMHFFWTAVLGTGDVDGFHVSLDSANSLGTEHQFLTESFEHGFRPGVFYDDVGVERVRAPLEKDAGGGDKRIMSCEVNDDGTPVFTRVSEFTPKLDGFGTLVCFALETKKIHALFPDLSTQDLFRDENDDDGGWGTDVEILDAVTIDSVTCNVYDRSGAKLAYVYDDGGAVKYNEFDLGGGTPVSQTMESDYEGLGGLSPGKQEAFESLIGVRREL